MSPLLGIALSFTGFGPQGDIDRLNPTSAQPSKAIATFVGTRPASCPWLAGTRG